MSGNFPYAGLFAPNFFKDLLNPVSKWLPTKRFPVLLPMLILVANNVYETPHFNYSTFSHKNYHRTNISRMEFS